MCHFFRFRLFCFLFCVLLLLLFIYNILSMDQDNLSQYLEQDDFYSQNQQQNTMDSEAKTDQSQHIQNPSSLLILSNSLSQRFNHLTRSQIQQHHRQTISILDQKPTKYWEKRITDKFYLEEIQVSDLMELAHLQACKSLAMIRLGTPGQMLQIKSQIALALMAKKQLLYEEIKQIVYAVLQINFKLKNLKLDKKIKKIALDQTTISQGRRKICRSLQKIKQSNRKKRKFNQKETKYQLPLLDQQSLKKYPLLLLDSELIMLRLETFYRSYDLNIDELDQQLKIYSNLFIVRASEFFEETFNEAKAHAKNLILNQANGFLLEYATYVKQYCQFQKDRRPKIGIIKSDEQIQKILLNGIEKAQMIMSPQKDVYGFTLNQIVYFDLNCFLSKMKKSTKNTKKQQIELLIALMCLKILHELAHLLIRQVGFDRKKKSFIQQDGDNRNKFLCNKYKMNNGKLIFNSVQISSQIVRFILQNEKKLIAFQHLLSQYQINKKSDQVRLKIFECVVFQLIKPVANDENFVKIMSEIKMKMPRKKNQSRYGGKLIEIFELVLKKKPSFFNVQKIQGKDPLPSIHLQDQLEAYLNKKYSSMNICEFIRSCCKKFQISNLKQSTQQQLIKQIQSQQIFVSEYQNVMFLARNIFGLEKIQGEIFIIREAVRTTEDIKNVEKISRSLDWSQKLFNLVEKNQFFHALYQNIPLLVQECNSFIEYSELNPLQKEDDLESGWILEKRLFSKLHGRGHIFSQDFQILKELQRQKDFETCKNLRNQFGNSEIVQKQKYSGLSISVKRQQVNKHLGPSIQWNHHYFSRI